MKLAMLSGALLVAGCASTPVDDSQPLARACSVSECFSQREIRDFEVIDPTTLIVYVGSQRCAFKVALRGTFCDMTFAPSVIFHKDEIGAREDSLFGDAITGHNPTGTDRICSNDIQVDVDGGVFTESVDKSALPTDRFGNRRSQCQIESVESLTDDGLVELYVKRGVVPPPPPIGQGQIKVEPRDGSEPAATPDNPVPPEPQAAPSADGEPRTSSVGEPRTGIVAN